MHFLFVAASYFPARKMGGPTNSVRALAEALVRQGHMVTVAAGNMDLDERMPVDTSIDNWVNGVRVRYFEMHTPLPKRLHLPGFRYTTVKVCGNDWKKWIRENIVSFDIVDIQICFLSFAPLAVKLARKHGIPILYHQRGVLDPVRLRLGRIRKLIYIGMRERPLMRKADCLVALTAHEVDSFRAAGLDNRVEIVPNGIDRDYGEKPISPGEKTRELLSRLGTRTTFLWMSRIHGIKGADIFTDAFIELARTTPDICAVLAGSDEVGLESSLKLRVQEAGQEDRFFFPGTLSGDDKRAILRRSQVFVFPTLSEGFSMVVLEALASRCVVLTSKGAYFDGLEKSNAGLIVDRSPAAYVKAMRKLLEDGGQTIPVMSDNAWKLVREDFDLENIVGKYAELCQELHNAK